MTLSKTLHSFSVALLVCWVSILLTPATLAQGQDGLDAPAISKWFSQLSIEPKWHGRGGTYLYARVDTEGNHDIAGVANMGGNPCFNPSFPTAQPACTQRVLLGLRFRAWLMDTRISGRSDSWAELHRLATLRVKFI